MTKFQKIYLINFLLFTHIQSFFYLSMYIKEVDDCLNKIEVDNEIPFNGISECPMEMNKYPKGGNPIIENIIYELGKTIIIQIFNFGPPCYINMEVRINEYNIKISNNTKFWNSNDYKYFSDDDNKYYFNNAWNINSLNFTLDNISDLKNESRVEVNETFYAFISQMNFNYSIHYKNDECELINFNSSDKFYIKGNKSLLVDITNHKFRIIFMNQFNGTLIGLNQSNLESNISNNSFFYISESKGLKYLLSSEDKQKYYSHLNLKIQAYEIYLSKPVSEPKEFNFYINLVGDKFECLKEYFFLDSKNIYHYICSNLTKEEISSNNSELIDRIGIDKKYEIKGNNFTINISPLNSTFFNSSNYYNLTKCDEILRNKYNISFSKSVIYMQINDDENLQTELNYAYDENKILLNLSLCNETISEDISTYNIDPLKCYTKVYYFYDEISQQFKSCLNKTKEDLIKNISELIENIEVDQIYEIKGDDYNIKISPTNATYLSSISHVNFTKCEEILRDKNNISSSRYITFMQMEINNTNSKTLINKVEYQAYDDNKKQLNLSLCKDDYITITHSIKSSSLFDVVSASLFKDLGIDIFNINDSFFTDVCHSYSDSENDMTLKDRIRKIFQNFSLCEEGCYYNEIDLENMTITCDCKVKTDLNVDDIAITLLPFQNKSANFQIIKCYNLVFSLKGKLLNIGFWIFLILVTLHIPLLIVYCCEGIKPVKEYIIQQMKIYGYIKKDNNIKNKSNNQKFKNNKKAKIKNNKKKKKSTKNNPPKKNKDNNNDKNKNILFKTNKKNKSKIEGKAITIKSKIYKNNKKIKRNNKSSINFSKNSNTLRDSRQINLLETQVKGIKKKNNKKANKNKSKKIKTKENNIFNFRIININLNKRDEYVPQESKQILNNYTFEEAIKYDYRSICLIYYIILLSKQAIFHAFLFKSPLEVFSLRLCLLIFIYSSDLALNAFFYLDDKISEKYQYAKNFFLFAFSNNITVILLSTFIGFLFMTLFTNLSNSSNDIRNIFRKEEEKLIANKKYNVSDKRKKEILIEIEKVLTKFKIKMIILIIIEFSLMLFFWYYVTAFCHVYNKTQYSWLFDSFLSILSRTIFDFLIPLGLAKLYRMAVESNIKCIYKVVLFFYSFA